MKLKKISIFLFIFFISFFGLGSAINLVRVLVSDEKVNNQSFESGQLEDKFCSTFLFRDFYINVNGLFAKLVFQDELNGIVKMKNGYLTTPMGDISDDSLAYIDLDAQWISEMNSYLENEGIVFLYVQVPYKIDENLSYLPYGISDTSNERADLLVNRLVELNVPVLDYRSYIDAPGVDYYSYFYKTDHHWNEKAAFDCFLMISDYVEEKTGQGIDARIREIDNYEDLKLERAFLGVEGIRTGWVYANGYEDFEVYIPKFETKITDLNTGECGEYADVCLNVSQLYSINHCYNSFYNCSNSQNLEADNDLRVLIGGDSFSWALYPFMELSYHSVRTSYAAPAFSKELIDEYDPDVVILIVNPGFIPSHYFRCDGISEE